MPVRRPTPPERRTRSGRNPHAPPAPWQRHPAGIETGRRFLEPVVTAWEAKNFVVPACGILFELRLRIPLSGSAGTEFDAGQQLGRDAGQDRKNQTACAL